MNRMTKSLLLITICLVMSGTLLANAKTDIEFILGTTHPPKGIIFEVDESQESALKWALPKLQTYIKRLHQKFPDMKIALVTHGKEQFSLLTKNQAQYPIIHQQIQSFAKTDVPVHICGIHASWFNKSKVDFPDYVDVPESGPEQIKVYQRQGYALITMDQW